MRVSRAVSLTMVFLFSSITAAWSVDWNYWQRQFAAGGSAAIFSGTKRPANYSRPHVRALCRNTKMRGRRQCQAPSTFARSFQGCSPELEVQGCMTICGDEYCRCYCSFLIPLFLVISPD
jgi:hypothetical protein